MQLPQVSHLSEPATGLPALIDRAASALTNARSAAEILEARDMASNIYDMAKKQARLAKAKKAHDDVIGAAYRVQADALEIECGAKRRIADEYDAAQDRGEVGQEGRPKTVPKENGLSPATAADVGLTRKQIHEARAIRDAEVTDPGIVHRSLDAQLKSGKEPKKSSLRKTLQTTTAVEHKPRNNKAKRRKQRTTPAPVPETQHDRDLRYLRDVWGATCASARQEFLRSLGYEPSAQ